MDVDIGFDRVYTLTHDEPLVNRRAEPLNPAGKVALELALSCPGGERFLIDHADAPEEAHQVAELLCARPESVVPQM